MRILPLLFIIITPALAIFWPIPPLDSVHPLGNNWGNYQNYGGGGYFHNGIDIITPHQQGAEVRAVANGWVKAWGTIQEELHYRLAVCDSPPTYTGRAPGWLYAHIDPARYHKNLGDEVGEGELIGYLVPWPVTGFDHLHFARISDTGAFWQRFPNPTWWFIQNPLTLITPNHDLSPPVFLNARPGQRFAFCRNNTSTYLSPTALNGDVDIIAKIYDKTGFTTGDTIWDRLAPYLIEYSVKSAGGTTVIPWCTALVFAGQLDASLVGVVYKQDNTCRSRGDYSNRDYYYIITNSDGDSLIEATDTAGTWATAAVPDGNYWIIVRTGDIAGNTAIDSMMVTTNNGVPIVEHHPALLTAPLTVRPTPDGYQISFSITQSAPVRLLLFDQAGRQVARIKTGTIAAGEHIFNISPPEPGIYFLNFAIPPDQNYRAKITVIR